MLHVVRNPIWKPPIDFIISFRGSGDKTWHIFLASKTNIPNAKNKKIRLNFHRIAQHIRFPVGGIMAWLANYSLFLTLLAVPISNYLVFDNTYPTANRQSWWLWTGSVIFDFFRKMKSQLQSCCSANSLPCAWISWLDFITLSLFVLYWPSPDRLENSVFFPTTTPVAIFFWTIVINGMHCLFNVHRRQLNIASEFYLKRISNTYPNLHPRACVEG